MSRRNRLWVAVGILLLVLSGVSALAQEGGSLTCAQVVETALQAVDDACTGLGRNQTCYGHNRVDAVFWEARADLVFAAPSDRVPLPDVQQLTTARLDLTSGRWGVAALQLHGPDLPQTLPGQAVMFLLMGESLLANEVPPDQAALPVAAVTALTTGTVNLFTTPTTHSNTLGT
ncbi:MAG: hypothetical protein JW910_19315, partial [Anaerolineae bacterium]|nr:hypothetical protein [Anaerolineae bacterium]